jgi:hypothetical protein
MGILIESGPRPKAAQHAALSVTTWSLNPSKFHLDAFDEWVTNSLSNRWVVHIDHDAQLIRAAYGAIGSWQIDHDKKFGKLPMLTQVGKLERVQLCESGGVRHEQSTANCDLTKPERNVFVNRRLESIANRSRGLPEWLTR